MRKRFEQQNELDAQPIPDVKIDGKSRHELPQLLAGLQYIFITPHLNEAVLPFWKRKYWGAKKDWPLRHELMGNISTGRYAAEFGRGL